MRRGLDRFRARTVIAHTKNPDDRSIRGILVGDYRDCVVLENPEYLHEASATQMEGRVAIPKSNLAFVQEVSL